MAYKILSALRLNMYLIFDTETTGLPSNYSAPETDTSNWPRLVQLAWIQFDSVGNEIQSKSYIIKPKGFSIPSDAAKIHGITTERAKKEGVSLKKVLGEFSEYVDASSILVAHNISFDTKIIGAEFIRQKMPHKMRSKKNICTKEISTDYCELPGSYGKYKWPKLSELHYKLFGNNFKEAHNALIDAEACAKCFFELKKQGVVQ